VTCYCGEMCVVGSECVAVVSALISRHGACSFCAALYHVVGDTWRAGAVPFCRMSLVTHGLQVLWCSVGCV
jgi:hypothetical protein